MMRPEKKSRIARAFERRHRKTKKDEDKIQYQTKYDDYKHALDRSKRLFSVSKSRKMKATEKDCFGK